MTCNLTAEVERAQIVRHIRLAAAKVMGVGMTHKQTKLHNLDLIVTLMEDIAEVIEEGDHWRPLA